MVAKRNTKDSWIEAGLSALISDGAPALGAETLARKIGVTKGSFYWHFKDVGAFHTEVLQRWSQTALAKFEALLDAEDTAPKKLRGLGRLGKPGPSRNDARLENAVRAWAQTDRAVAKALAALDAERVERLTVLLTELDITDPHYARALFGAWIGLGLQDPKARAEPIETFVDLVLALR